MLDDHGQPLNRRYSGKRLNDRTIDELIGISRGLIADQNINKTDLPRNNFQNMIKIEN